MENVTTASFKDVDLKMSYEKKLKEALNYLGENWVLHPNYKPNPRHNVFGSSPRQKQSQ